MFSMILLLQQSKPSPQIGFLQPFYGLVPVVGVVCLSTITRITKVLFIKSRQSLNLLMHDQFQKMFKVLIYEFGHT